MEMEAPEYKIYLVNQRSPLVQLDDPFAVLASTSPRTKLYKWFSCARLELNLDSNLCKQKPTKGTLRIIRSLIMHISVMQIQIKTR